MEDKDVLTYGGVKLRKGNLVDENNNNLVDENGNTLYGYGIVANED